MGKNETKMGDGVKFERIRRITGYLVGTMDKWNNAKLQNGDVITLDYYCEKATHATVSIVADDDSGYSTNVLQYEKHLMKRGDGVIDITLNVGDYVGKAIVGISYLGIYSNAFLQMDDIEEDRARTFNIEIVSKEEI